jgi:hypothetical protein
MILGVIGEEAGASDERLRQRLDALVEECCPAEESQAVAARLGIALGLGARSRDEGRYRVSELRSGLLALVAGLSGDRSCWSSRTSTWPTRSCWT